MKVQYLGDVNDYRKYALLRLLAGAGLKLGIHWLLTPDDGRSDGGNRGFLAQPDKWRPYDPELFDLLAAVPSQPSLADFQQIERSGIIPRAVFFDQVVPAGAEAREAYHAASMEAFQSCDLVFFDPDNGLATQSVTKRQQAGVKFVFDGELADHYQAGRSFLVYQHFPRVERVSFIRTLCTKLREFAPEAEIWACHTSHVAFMLVANSRRLTARMGAISAAVANGRDRWPNTFIAFQHLTAR